MVMRALLLHLTVLQEVRGVLVLSCSDYVDMQDTIIHIGFSVTSEQLSISCLIRNNPR